MTDNTADRRKAAADRGPVVLYGEPSKEEIAAARGRAGGRGVMIVPEELRNLEHPGFEDDGLESHEWTGEPQHPESKRLDQAEEHMHYTDRATRLCAEGDHDSAELWDRDAERIKVRENAAYWTERMAETVTVDPEKYVTMAAEPIEERLRRAFLNGFKEGVDRSSFAATEVTGKWDY